MRYFEEQIRARRRTLMLVALFGASVVLTVIVTDLFFGMAFGMVQWIGLDLDTPISKGLDTKNAPTEALWLILQRTWQLLVPEWLIWVLSAVVLAIMVAATVRRMRAISKGGTAIARLLEARPVLRVGAAPLEQRLLNVVEEMAIAAALPVPRVFLLDRAAGINALTAGFTPRDAVIVVTRGALVSLEREELQGMVAHEISHLVNGDVRLNTWMIGLLAGLVSVGALGSFLLAPGDAASPSGIRRLTARAALGMPLAMLGGVGLFLLGVAFALLGGAGLVFARLIKATLSREREFLADASAVQFTRNPEALAGALARIEGHRYGSRLYHRHAEALSHMFFAPGVLTRIAWLFATHPPIAERIARIAPGLHAERYLRKHPSRSEAEMLEQALRESLERAPHEGTVALEAGFAADGLVASIGNPSIEHARYAKGLLDSLPGPVRDAMATADGARSVLLALALAPETAARAAQLGEIERADPLLAAMTRETARQLPSAASPYRLPIVELAMPMLASLDHAERVAFLDLLRSVIAADGRLTPREFVLYVLLRQALLVPLRPSRPRYRAASDIPGDASLILALLASAQDGMAGEPSFHAALAAAGLPRIAPPPAMSEVALERVVAALERLDAVAPLAKPAFIKACVIAVAGTSGIRVQEAELLRAVAVAVDCPLPPLGVGEPVRSSRREDRSA